MSEVFQASQEVSVADPAPAPESPLHFLSLLPHLIPSSRSGACCSPPWSLYLFILHQQGCCRLILAWFKKREEERGTHRERKRHRVRDRKRERRNAFWLLSLSWSWRRGRSNSRGGGGGSHSSPAGGLMQQAAGEWEVICTGELEGPRCSSNGTSLGEIQRPTWCHPPASPVSAPALFAEVSAALSHGILKDKARLTVPVKERELAPRPQPTIHPAPQDCDWKTKMPQVTMVGRTPRRPPSFSLEFLLPLQRVFPPQSVWAFQKSLS